jgi:hypothetical protein
LAVTYWEDRTELQIVAHHFGHGYFGLVIGTNCPKIDGAKLKPAFSWFVLVMGIYIIVTELFL